MKTNQKQIELLVQQINTNLIRLNGNNIFQTLFKVVFKRHKCIVLYNGSINKVGTLNQVYKEFIAFLPLTQ